MSLSSAFTRADSNHLNDLLLTFTSNTLRPGRH